MTMESASDERSRMSMVTIFSALSSSSEPRMRFSSSASIGGGTALITSGSDAMPGLAVFFEDFLGADFFVAVFFAGARLADFFGAGFFAVFFLATRISSPLVVKARLPRCKAPSHDGVAVCGVADRGGGQRIAAAIDQGEG